MSIVWIMGLVVLYYAGKMTETNVSVAFVMFLIGAFLILLDWGILAKWLK